jgi:hypothetical protein
MLIQKIKTKNPKPATGGWLSTAALIVVYFFTVSVGGFFACSPCLANIPDRSIGQHDSSVKTKEITLRNLTKKAVVFTIKSSHSSPQSERKILAKGELERFTEGTSLFVIFQREGKSITYRLSPGMTYSFRYNENDELELYEGSHGRTDVVDLAPYVTTPMIVVDKMLQIAQVTENDIVYDLGCGDGRIVILAAKKFGARGVGIDLDPERIKECKAYAREAGVEDLVEFHAQDAMKADISRATVVTLYLLPESNALLRPLLEEQLKPGARVVSHNYHIPGWEIKETGYTALTTGDGELHTIFVYQK